MPPLHQRGLARGRTGLRRTPASVPCPVPLPSQRQAQVLVDTFGMDPMLPAVLRELWLAFLAHSRLLEPDTLM